eukprot:2677091-Pyramimonas_sp.AAC.1
MDVHYTSSPRGRPRPRGVRGPFQQGATSSPRVAVGRLGGTSGGRSTRRRPAERSPAQHVQAPERLGTGG